MSVKVALINPPSSYVSYVPPPGLAYLSASLKEYGCDVAGIDATAPYKRLKVMEVFEKIKKYSPDIVGVSLNLYFIKGGYDLAREVSKLGIPLIAGGPHMRMCSEEALENHFDIVVTGEGELTIREIVDYVREKKDISEIKGIVYKNKSGQIIKNSPVSSLADMDSLPFADRELFSISDYIGPGQDFSSFAFPFFSGRGCPFRCIFCTVSSRTCRKRSVENLFKEIDFLRNTYGLKSISFLDELFTLDKKWLNAFLDEFIRRDLDIIWNCESRVDTVNAEYLFKMKKAKCNSVWFGIESGSAETLKLVKKGIKVDDIEKMLEILVKVDLPAVKLNFMWGFPWEKKEHIMSSAKIIRKYTRKLRVLNSIVVPLPYPGTELYEMYHEEYGFTKWWLNEKSFGETSEKSTPYFKLNSLIFDTHLADINIFKHSRVFNRFLSRMIVKHRKIVYRSSVGFWRTEIIYLLSLISRRLYKIRPDLEVLVFKLLRKLDCRKYLGMNKK